MYLNAWLHRNARIDFVDGDSMNGYIDAHISAEDNFPDGESIILRCENIRYEISIEEIKKVTILKS